jgi:hypothetical protein
MTVAITKTMIRKHFGEDCEVRRKLFGGFNVTTPTGGDVDIKGHKISVHSGGEDVYQAMVSLAAEAWGSVTAFGPDDHVLATMAHGEALDVQVTPIVEDSGTGCLRFFLAILMLVIGFWIVTSVATTPNEQIVGGIIALLVTVKTDGFLKKAAKRAERRAGQKYRNLQPNIHGGRRDASRDDAKRKGWL